MERRGGSERVVLVIDGDNIRSGLNMYYDGLAIDWVALREVAHRAVHQLQRPPVDGSRVYHSVAPVQKAAIYLTRSRFAGESWQAYQQRCRRFNRQLIKYGYEPHLMRPRRGDEPDAEIAQMKQPPPGYDPAFSDEMLGYRYGYRDEVVKRRIARLSLDYDTLIIASSDSDFWPEANAWWRNCTRAFVVGVRDRMRADRSDLIAPWIDLVEAMIRFSRLFYSSKPLLFI